MAASSAVLLLCLAFAVASCSVIKRQVSESDTVQASTLPVASSGAQVSTLPVVSGDEQISTAPSGNTQFQPLPATPESAQASVLPFFPYVSGHPFTRPLIASTMPAFSGVPQTPWNMANPDTFMPNQWLPTWPNYQMPFQPMIYFPPQQTETRSRQRRDGDSDEDDSSRSDSGESEETNSWYPPRYPTYPSYPIYPVPAVAA